MLDTGLLLPHALATLRALLQAYLDVYGPQTLGNPGRLFRPDALERDGVVPVLNQFDGWVAVSRRRGYPDVRGDLIAAMIHALSPLLNSFPAAVQDRFKQLAERTVLA